MSRFWGKMQRSDFGHIIFCKEDIYKIQTQTNKIF